MGGRVLVSRTDGTRWDRLRMLPSAEDGKRDHVSDQAETDHPLFLTHSHSLPSQSRPLTSSSTSASTISSRPQTISQRPP